MRVRQIMTPRPLTAGAAESPADLARLMEAAQIHHLPRVEGGRLVGLWIAGAEGPLVLLGPEAVHETTPEADAEEAIAALLAGSEAALAWEDGRPAGLVTRADVLRIVRAALARGLGGRSARPVVLRLVGPAGAGKTALITRTLPLLRGLRCAVVQANSPLPAGEEAAQPEDAAWVEAPEAHWRAGLRAALERLADAQLIVLEDRDGPPVVSRGVGGDLEAVVVPAADAAALEEATLREAQAVVLTKLDAAPPGFSLQECRERLRAVNGRLGVFGLAGEDDERGLAEWAEWLWRQVLPRQH